MHIDPKGTIAGFPSLDVRKLMKRASHMWTPGFVADVLHVPRSEAEELVKRLEREGYVERVTDHDGYWTTTLLGNRLGNASAAKPITRASADRIVEELLGRVKEVNGNDYYLYEVERVVVFGSYLTDHERINDIDLAVTLAAKEEDRDRRSALDRQRTAEAAEGGRRFRNIVDQLFWPRSEVLLFLKSRSRAISLHEPEELNQLGVEGRVLFQK